MSQRLKVILRSGKDDAVRRFHPWVFSGAIKKMIGPEFDGCTADVYSNRDEYLGCGIYQDAAIAVRILDFAPAKHNNFDAPFWSGKIRSAYRLRETANLAVNPHTNVYRLVHGEGDHLPGLIIDHYDGHLVVQVHSTGLYTYIDQISEGIKPVYGKRLRSIYDKSRETLPADFWQENETRGYLFKGDNDVDKEGHIRVRENGNDFLVDITGGQKTGFFIDQRENRLLLSRYSKGKRVLNTFSYSGGFSVYALKAGAESVDSVDSSKKAVKLSELNAVINGVSERHTAHTGDVMEYLKSAEKEYDLIILDPPAYAKHQNVRHKAVQGYKRLNLEALKRISSGGILFTFSCSQVVDMKLFQSTVMSAAILAGRKVRILHQLTQPADHPVNIFHPEGHYLKGLVLLVD